MSRALRLFAAACLIGVLAGCAIGVGGAGGPRCDRNGDEEQQIACVR